MNRRAFQWTIGIGMLLSFPWAMAACSSAGNAKGSEPDDRASFGQDDPADGDAPTGDEGEPPPSNDEDAGVPPGDDAGGPPSTAKLPADVLDLTNWKETLPTGSSGKPKEVKQPALATFSASPYFALNEARNGVQFRAPTNGVTTSGSKYPRSELREMTDDGKSNASWSTTSGTHTLIIDEAITAVPETKKHVVAGQIHDADDDVIVIRLEFPKLFVDINGETGPTLDEDYTLGKRFKVKFVASGGKVNVYYNDGASAAYTLNKSTSGCYFKVGAYTQSNCDTESSCGADNYGEVNVYGVQVTHE